MYCSYCGKEIVDSDKYCRHCGGFLEGEKPTPVKIEDPKPLPNPPKVKPQPKRERVAYVFSNLARVFSFLSLVGFVFVGAAFAIVSLILNRNKELQTRNIISLVLSIVLSFGVIVLYIFLFAYLISQLIVVI